MAAAAEEDGEDAGKTTEETGKEGEDRAGKTAARPRIDHGFEVVEKAFPENVAGSLSRVGAWLPVYVELKATSGRTVQVLLEGHVGEARESGRAITRQWVEVSPGAPRRAWLYLRVPPGERGSEVRFEVKSAAGAVVDRGPEDWRVNAYERSERRVAFLIAGSGLGNLLPWADHLRMPGRNWSRTAEGWPGKQLPDSLLGYSAFDVVILQDLGDEDLEPAQVEALRAWVHLGGVVVLAPNSLAGDVFRTRIAGVLFGNALGEPKLTESFAPREIFPAARGGILDLQGREPLLKLEEKAVVTLHDPLAESGSREVLAVPHGPLPAEGPARLYAEFPYGRGTAGLVTAYAPQKTILSEGPAVLEILAAVWKQVLEWNAGDGDDHAARAAANFQASELSSLLQDSSRDVGLPFITGVIGFYLLLVGPGLYFLLKRRNRLPAVVWVEPLLVVVYLGVIFATGYITKGVLTKTKLLTFISQVDGAPIALRSSYLTIFSAGEETYRIDCPRGTVVNPLFFNEKEERPVTLSRQAKGGLALEGYRLGHWEQGHVRNWEVLDAAGSGLEIEPLPSPTEAPRVAVTNRLAYPVLEGVVFRNRIEIALPRIEPGETVTAGAEDSPGAGARDAEKGAGSGGAEKGAWRRAVDLHRRGRGRGDLLAVALIDRADADFQVDKRTTLKERADIYLFLDGGR